MCLIGSFYEPITPHQRDANMAQQGSIKIQEVIKILLTTHPELLSAVDRGQVNQSILEMETIKVLDQQGLQWNRQEMIETIFNEMFGYGILQSVIEDEAITDIIGTRYNCFFVKREGHMLEMPLAFESNEAFETFCKLIIIRNGGILNENDNHARVGDETHRLRINVTIPPRAIGGPLLNIRKHRKCGYSLEDLQALGMLDDAGLSLMKKLATSQARLLICGKGASGKTTLLRAMLNYIGASSRILVCESDVELYPDSPTIVGQKIIQRGSFGKSVTLEDLIKDGLTMSLDGYCIGEITGIEAWTYIKAGYTNHRTLATIHSTSAVDVVNRLMMLSQVTQQGHTEEQAKSMICGALDYVLHLEGFRLMEIFRIEGYDAETAQIQGQVLTPAEALCQWPS